MWKFRWLDDDIFEPGPNHMDGFTQIEITHAWRCGRGSERAQQEMLFLGPPCPAWWWFFLAWTQYKLLLESKNNIDGGDLEATFHYFWPVPRWTRHAVRWPIAALIYQTDVLITNKIRLTRDPLNYFLMFSFLLVFDHHKGMADDDEISGNVPNMCAYL